MLSKLLNLFKSSTAKPSLGELATSMGLERRRHYRALYPTCHSPYVLPQIRFEEFNVKAKDISEGGFCITSNALTEKLSVGDKYDFELFWCEKEQKEQISATLIGVSFERIHFQFNEVALSCVERLSTDITVASRGMRLSPSFPSLNSGIESDFKELWVNALGDKLVFKKSAKPLVEGTWMSRDFQLNSDTGTVSWPADWSMSDRYGFLVFVSNVPAASADLKLLIKALMQNEQRREIA
jgi:hypothetical protein